MLLQFTGLALSIAAIITGGLIAELVFSYPGLGTLLFNAIGQNDYPVWIDTPGDADCFRGGIVQYVWGSLLDLSAPVRSWMCSR